MPGYPQLLAFAVICCLPATTAAAESALEVVDRAFKARCEKPEDFEKQRTQIVDMEGKIYADSVQKVVYPATRRMKIDGIGHFRWESEVEMPTGKVRQTLAVLGNSGWSQANAMPPEDMSSALVDECKMEIYGRWYATLIPLKDKALTLTLLPDAKVDEQVVQVVRAALRFRPDVYLSFSKETGRLLKIAYRAREGGVDLRKEHYFYDYKPIQGLVLPTRLLDMKQEGQNSFKLADWKVKEYKLAEKLAVGVFEKPAK
jgi:hypothetical protein